MIGKSVVADLGNSRSVDMRHDTRVSGFQNHCRFHSVSPLSIFVALFFFSKAWRRFICFEGFKGHRKGNKRQRANRQMKLEAGPVTNELRPIPTFF